MSIGVRKIGLFMVVVLLALTLWPAVVLACPPILKSVTLEPGSNHPTSVWELPPNVTSQFIQTSASAEVTLDGYFRHVESFDTFAPDQTTYVDQFNFSPGVYYVHIAGHDKRCNGSTCPAIEFSEIMSFEVTAAQATAASFGYRAVRTSAISCSETPAGPLPPLPPTTGGPGRDTIAPIEALSFAGVQDIDKLFVRARMSEAGTLTARATVKVGRKTYRFKKVSRPAAANVFTKLRLRLAKKRDLHRAKRALRNHKRLRAKVTVTAVDAAANKHSQKATVRLVDRARR